MNKFMHVVILSGGATIADVARALEFTGFAISNTIDPNVFVISPALRTLPPNVVPFERPALLRRQAE